MAKISTSTLKDFRALQDTITVAVNGSSTFERASQAYTQAVYAAYHESVVLVRQFATTPYQELPLPSRAFVERLVQEKGLSQKIQNATLILNLLGTSGVKPEWNNRSQSKGHSGIPLISAAFIDAIPMMSRLLRELGLGLDWIDRQDTNLVIKTMGSMSGVFFVRDAAQEVDHLGRKIIAAQDFVKAHDIKSVFGFGGAYLGTKTFSITILFLRETIEKGKAEQFAAAMSGFKAQTLELVKTHIFG
ncbi:hypothetical protein U14_02290 [Candidatus Moduliflexus flocculans]|uniref:Uncharacterized protein n=1 Tax=Candidatus Moduliflexus flocculans TaxID=1499966 RepID=A0A0S6VU12_9BACT|nr:hypothetical protein U14_02290 [Candidatus Moduliflexus flocculans]